MNLQPSQVVSVRNQGCLSQNNSESPVAVEHALIRGGLLDFCLGDWKRWMAEAVGHMEVCQNGTPEIIHFTVGCSILNHPAIGDPPLKLSGLNLSQEYRLNGDMSSQLPLMEHFNRTSTSINPQRLN